MVASGPAVAKRLQPACRLAVEVAIEGEVADPRVPAPPALRPILGFSRLSAAAYGVIQRVIDEDGTFRGRVAEQATEEKLGRAGWLWLTRPVDWADDAAFSGVEVTADRPTGSPKASKDAVARLRKAAAEADAARRKAAEQLAEVKRHEAEHRRGRAAAEAKVRKLEDERSAAMRAAKALEAELAAARRDLKVARAATRQAEAELLALRSDPSPRVPAPPVAVTSSQLEQAAAAAAELAASLAELARPKVEKPRKAPKKRSSAGRRQPPLPPGVFDGTIEAHRHLIAAPANLIVVDGYNVARAAWSGLAPEEERRRTVALLDDVQARSGGKVIVVFDGDDAVTAPKASKSVRVRFSATGETADDAITDLVSALPVEEAVVVVSSDRAVAADAKRLGAVAIGSKAFLAAAGR